MNYHRKIIFLFNRHNLYGQKYKFINYYLPVRNSCLQHVKFRSSPTNLQSHSSSLKMNCLFVKNCRTFLSINKCRLIHRFCSSAAKAAPIITPKKLVVSRPELTRLLGLTKPERWTLAGGIALLLVSSTVSMAVPFALGHVIDVIYTADAQQMVQNLNKLCTLLIGVFLVGALCNFGRVYLMNIAGQRITRDLRQNVFTAIMNQEIAYFDTNKTGELVNRLSADTQLVSKTLTLNVSDGLRSVIMVIAGVSMMFYMSPQLAAVGLAVVPPTAALAVVYGRFVRNITKQLQDSLAAATQVAEERIANVRTVKYFSREPHEERKYSKALEEVLQLCYKESLARGVFFGMTGLTGNIIILAVLYTGGVMVSDASLTVGNLSSFLLYAAYIGVSIGGLSSFYSELNQGVGASHRLWQIMDRVPAIPIHGGLIPNQEPSGNIKLQDISFTYPTREHSTIRHLDLTLPAGSMTALVGASGSGKSSVAGLLLRLYDPQQGRVLLDGVDLKELDMKWLRKHIGFVSQEPVLFSGTIRENIMYGSVDDVAEDKFLAVTKEANCYDFITNDLPEGFETIVGERGAMLSGGQRQRIAIARALIRNPRILILDEATSALDSESEHLVQDALERIMKGRTVLTIAHRLSTVKSADQIAVLENGHVVESGSYNELLTKDDGVFKKLVQYQTFLKNTKSKI